MKFTFVFLSVVLLCSFFQATFLSLNLILLLVLILAFLRPTRQTFWLAFFSGLLLDLAKGMPLGFSSFLFLVFSLLFGFYRRRFDVLRPFFFSVFVLVAAAIYNRLVFLNWYWFQALLLAFLAFLTRPFLKHFQSIKGELKLKL